LEKRHLFSGNEALGRGAYEAGIHVAAAYPGTPSTEILQYLSQFQEIDSQWSVNEKVAYEVTLGAAIGGARSLYASKHVGLNVAMDPLMTSSYTGINAGFVAVVCDDPGLASSQNEQDSRWVSIFSKTPLVEPASPAEAYLFIKEAFLISEKFDTPVLFRMTTRVAHSKEDIAIGERVSIPIKELTADIAKYVMVPRNAYQKHIEVEKRLLDLARYSETTSLNQVEMGSSNIGFITSGVSYSYIKEQYPDASVLKLGFVYPFCDNKIRAFAAGVKEIFVIEELDPFIEQHVRTLGIKCKSRHRTYHIGEIRPEYLPHIIEGKVKVEAQFNTRKPALCGGCPHRFVFTTLRKLKIFVAGDLGCYTLGALQPLSSMHTNLCMGAGITFHEGLRRAHPERNIVGIIGDSTFIHSGITGLINAVYNNVKGVLLILDNATTAMTGRQSHPATGTTITGKSTPKLIIEDLVKACGVDNVDVLSPVKIKDMESLIRQRLAEDSLSVIIAREPCRLLERNKQSPPVYIIKKCKRCGICLTIDCPNIIKNSDGSILIDQEHCVGCNLCVEVCPTKALKAQI
jgi:indolepyruvate ferredoxin oxidoreductase alpha subunit